MTYQCVPDGYYRANPFFVDYAKVWKNGTPEESAHYILHIGFKPVRNDRTGEDCPDDAQIYYADLPLIFDESEDYDFYDQNAKAFVPRKPTVTDSANAVSFARKVFPAWNQAILEAKTNSEAFDWFFSEAFKAVECTIKVVNTTKTGKPCNRAYLFETIEKKAKVTRAEWDAKREKAARAIFGAKKAAPKPPSAPKAITLEEAKEAALSAYEKAYAGDDPQNENFYALVAEAIGKDQSTWESWTSSEWLKARDTFATEK